MLSKQKVTAAPTVALVNLLNLLTYLSHKWQEIASWGSTFQMLGPLKRAVAHFSNQLDMVAMKWHPKKYIPHCQAALDSFPSPCLTLTYPYVLNLSIKSVSSKFKKIQP